MKRNRWHKSDRSGKRHRDPSLLERINPDVAGLDLHSSAHFVAVPTDRDPDPVQSFGTVTSDLYRLVDWLTSCGIRSVAMEATGVYWISVFEILEAKGFEVLLVNAERLAQHRDTRCHASKDEFVAALTGDHPEHVFALKQNLELFDIHQTKLADCDAAIEPHLQRLAEDAPPSTTKLPPARRRRSKPVRNEPAFDMRT